MKRSPLVTAGIAAAILISGSPAYADHGGTSSAGTPDNTSQGVTNSGVLTNLGIDAMYQGAEQLNRTDITTKLGDKSDIFVYDYKYGDNGLYGLTKCRGGGDPNHLCNVFEVRFNQSTLPRTVKAWESVGCHELGHTAGLGHRGTSKSSCMREIISEGWPRKLDAHDIDAVNDVV